jgi:5-methylcytosine-specific restriction endonuclease McrA
MASNKNMEIKNMVILCNQCQRRQFDVGMITYTKILLNYKL